MVPSIVTAIEFEIVIMIALRAILLKAISV